MPNLLLIEISRTLLHTYREGNFEVDSMANQSLSYDFNLVIWNSPRLSMREILFSDVVGVAMPCQLASYLFFLLWASALNCTQKKKKKKIQEKIHGKCIFSVGGERNVKQTTSI